MVVIADAESVPAIKVTPDWTASLKVAPGFPLPYGVSKSSDGANFSVYTLETTFVKLVLYPSQKLRKATEFSEKEKETRRVEIALDSKVNRTGRVWHVLVTPYLEEFEYMWKVGEKSHPKYGTNLCLDPYARVLNTPQGSQTFNNGEPYKPRAVIPPLYLSSFDWAGIQRPNIPLKDLVIYEMHIRGFTMSPDSNTKAPGTYLGVIEKIPYLKKLGVNCVEFLPVFEFNESEWDRKNPVTGKKLCNFWGYNTIGFFAPMHRYASEDKRGAAMDEFKTMVRELHRAGIEVFLDIVFNHTAEGGDQHYLLPGWYHFKGLAPETYYIMSKGKYHNYSGCGNSVNANNPVVTEFIHECMRFWVHEMGVDGFRFDLASAITRDMSGKPMSNPPVIERMTKDPTMRDIKLIAEPWDCGGLYQVGNFPHLGHWGEWNGKYRDCVRRFIKGDAGTKGDFATRICGSADLYKDGRKPYHSINFIVAHDGFTLMDVVSYNNKHNDANGEKNNDGDNHNNSWNCGEEGKTSKKEVNELRNRQVRNFMVALMISSGVPMMHMGDEYGHTKDGNNNVWCQDGEANYFNWKKLEQNQDLFRFFSVLIKLRRSIPWLNRSEFLGEKDITWHGSQPNAPNWSSDYNFLALTLHDHEKRQDLYVAFNAGNTDYEVVTPTRHDGYRWYRIVDTNLAPPRDISEGQYQHPIGNGGKYRMRAYSSLILRALPGGEKTSDMNLNRLRKKTSKISSMNRIASSMGLAGISMGPLSGAGAADVMSVASTSEAMRPSTLRESPSSIQLAAPPPLVRSFSRWELSSSTDGLNFATPDEPS